MPPHLPKCNLEGTAATEKAILPPLKISGKPTGSGHTNIRQTRLPESVQQHLRATSRKRIGGRREPEDIVDRPRRRNDSYRFLTSTTSFLAPAHVAQTTQRRWISNPSLRLTTVEERLSVHKGWHLAPRESECENPRQTTEQKVHIWRREPRSQTEMAQNI